MLGLHTHLLLFAQTDFQWLLDLLGEFREFTVHYLGLEQVLSVGASGNDESTGAGGRILGGRG